ncbi:GLUG motif-containing protein [Natronospora cellulosivora (SeqCode)]
MFKKRFIFLFLILSIFLLIACESDQLPFYELDVVIEGEGSVNLDPESNTYFRNDIIKLEAIAEENWKFSHWNFGGEEIDKNPYDDFVINANTTVYAYFSEKSNLKTISQPENGGSIKIVPEKEEYFAGDRVLLEAHPNPGYYFTEWSSDVSATDNPVEVIVQENMEVTANFGINTYEIKFSENSIREEGNITVEASNGMQNVTRFEHGEDIKFIAEPGSNYEFSHWQERRDRPPHGETEQIVTIQAESDLEVSAVFERVFQVSFKNYDGTIIDEQTVRVGEDAQAPDDPVRNGYIFTGWDNDFENLKQDIEVKAEFKIGLTGEGTSSSPYQIYTPENLVLIGKDNYSNNAYYQLMNDIDLENFGEFESIKEFEGVFDGKGHEIRNLYINQDEKNDLGLFAENLGEIKNIGLLDLEIRGRENVGGLVGINNGVITNSFVKGNISGNKNVGGLVGIHNTGTIENSHSNVDLIGINNKSGPNSRIGGLVGAVGTNGVITNSYAKGTITGYLVIGGLVGSNRGIIEDSHVIVESIKSNRNTGGLVGINRGAIEDSYTIAEKIDGSTHNIGGLVGWNNSGIIQSSQAIVDVTGRNSVGGLVGRNEATIKESYAKGNVQGDYDIGGLVGSNYEGSISNSYAICVVDGDSNIGGLVGHTSSESTIMYSFSAGEVEGNENYGGLIGLTDTSSGTILSYWDIKTSKQNSSASGIGRTTSEMQEESTYDQWDFMDIWAIDEGNSYPYLQWERD